jgi:hypothetical protein
MKDQALIIKTGEILNIEQKIFMVNVSIDIESKSYERIKEYLKFDNEDKDISDKEDNIEKNHIYYRLSDGNTYREDEIIIGLDNIRNFKLETLL